MARHKGVKLGTYAKRPRATTAPRTAASNLDERQMQEWLGNQTSPPRQVDPWNGAMDLLNQVIVGGEVVRLYNLDPSTPATTARRHHIPAVKCGDVWLFRKSDCERLWGHRRVREDGEAAK